MAAAIVRGIAGGLCLTSAVFLTACGATNGAGDVFGNLLAFHSVHAPPASEAPKAIVRVDCPEVSLDDQAATVRTYAGADHSQNNVRYQFDISQYARQCDVQGGQLAIKVGVSGRLVLGQAGTAGSFSTPVRVAIKRQSDGKIAAEKTYQASVSLAPGAGEGLFTTVSDPLVVPLISEQANNDYSIVVGLGSPPAPAVAKRPSKHKRG